MLPVGWQPERRKTASAPQT